MECETTAYSVLTSISDFPSYTRYNTLLKEPLIKFEFRNEISNNNLTLDYLRKSVLGVFIYYSELKYTLISEHEKILFVDLVSNIGGTLGLFVELELVF